MAFLQLFELFILISIIGLIFLLVKCIRIVRPFERGLIERFGKYQRTVDPGIVLLLPFTETLKKLDMREKVIDVPAQEVITKDNAGVLVDALIYLEICDPRLAFYNVQNYEVATTKLAQTSLRNIIGGMELDQTLISREEMNRTLKLALDSATDKWGLNVTRVELQKIEPPKDITEAMSKQMKAERTRRAAILEAEGFKQAAILKAEGEKQAAILQADGKSSAIQKIADAEKYRETITAEGKANAIQKVYDAIHKGVPTNDLIAIKYLETLEKIADGKATKIFLPVETSGILGSLGAIKELFSETKELKKEIRKTKTE